VILRSVENTHFFMMALSGITLCLVLAGRCESLDIDRADANQAFPVESAGGATAERAPPILLFDGIGSSPNDVAAIESILNNNQLTYVRVSSEQLDAMDESQFQAHRLLIVPGGNFVDMGNGLQAHTTATIRRAETAALRRHRV
jgi:hypothetical protein